MYYSASVHCYPTGYIFHKYLIKAVSGMCNVNHALPAVHPGQSEREETLADVSTRDHESLYTHAIQCHPHSINITSLYINNNN